MTNTFKLICLSFAIIFLAGACDEKKERKLPVLGRKEVVAKKTNGESTGYDTIYHTIPKFQFVNQDSNIVTEATFKNKIYISDFFFTSCPTICPAMKAQMLRVYDSIANNPDVLILSHTIDPQHDTVAVLKDFAEKLGVNSNKWHFVTGNKEEIFKIGQTSYMVTAIEDQSEPGGYVHSGAFILVDKARRVRGLYDGTKADQVNKLIADLAILEQEYEKKP